MTDYFDEIVENVIIRHEGGYNDIAEDKGGATNFGISLRFMKGLDPEDSDINDDGHVSKEDIRALTTEDAKHLYRKYFWDHYNIAQFRAKILQAKMFSLLINMRGRTAMRCMQRAIRSCGVKVKDDGLFGDQSRLALRKSLELYDETALLTALRSEAACIYRMIVKRDPSQSKFLNGWLNRAYD